MGNREQNQAVSLQSVMDQLDRVLESREAIAAAVTWTAGDVSGSRQKQMLALARWIERRVTAKDVLQRPDALSICLPLMQLADEGPLQTWQIEDAVRRGCDRLESVSTRSRRFVAMLIYPLAILILCALLLSLICVFLVPEFEKMFDEFGLSLPPLTEFIIWVSHQIQAWGILFLVVTSIAVVACLLVDQIQRSRGERSFWEQRFNAMFTSARGAWAAWAWHVSLLIDAGLSQSDAVATAGGASPKSWLKRASAAWANQLSGGMRPFDDFNYVQGQPCHLLVYAMRSENDVEQVALLREVAAVYRDRDLHKSCWWLAWFSPAVVLMVGGCVGLVVVALFNPLLELITGLS